MISVFGSLVGEEEVEAVSRTMRAQWMGFGSLVSEFEEKFSERTGVINFAMVDSGSNALFMAVKLLNLPLGSEVIVPSFTWVSCAQAVLLAGCKPIFCDVDLSTMNVRPVDVEQAITDKTSAIMVVHYAGLPVDIDELYSFGLPIIEDAAHAVDSTYRGRPCGTLGDVAIFSFDAVKNLTVGEGGGIAVRDRDLLKRARNLRYCGIGKSGFESASSNTSDHDRWWEYNISEPFIKMLPTNMAAAIGLEQLKRLDSMQIRRREIWDYYQTELASRIPAIKLPHESQEHDRHSYFTYCIRTAKRDELARHLLKRGIYTTLRYHPLHLNEIYGQEQKKLKNSETLNREALSIPLHPRLSDVEVEKVVDEIASFYT